MTYLSVENIIFIEDKLRDNQLPIIDDLIAADKKEVEFYIKVRNEIILILKSRSGVKDVKSNLEHFNQSFFKEDRSTNQPHQNPKSKRRLYRMAAAASLVLIVGFGLQRYAANEYCSACIADKFQTTLDLDIRSDNNVNEEYQKFIISYEKGDYAALVTELTADPGLQSDPKRLLMLANLYYKLKYYDLAIQRFTELGALDLAFRSEYYYGVISSQMAKGNMEKALEINQKALIDKHLNSIHQFLTIEKALSHPLRRLSN